VNGVPPFLQHGLFVAPKRQIIHITRVTLYAQALLDKPIQPIQVVIGKILAGLSK
jgi:hypothetical protein